MNVKHSQCKLTLESLHKQDLYDLYQHKERFYINLVSYPGLRHLSTDMLYSPSSQNGGSCPSEMNIKLFYLGKQHHQKKETPLGYM